MLALMQNTISNKLITSPQRHLRKARRSSADEKNNKLLVSRSPSKLTVKSRSWPNTV